VNETGLDGKLISILNLAPKDVSAEKTALEMLGLELTPAKRAIETITVSGAPIHAGTQ
jgi:hypothetical protein